MAYEKTWHRDYAAESLKRAETSRWTQDANLEWTQLALECAQVVHLARQVGEELGNEKIIGIADTVLDNRSPLASDLPQAVLQENYDGPDAPPRGHTSGAVWFSATGSECRMAVD